MRCGAPSRNGIQRPVAAPLHVTVTQTICDVRDAFRRPPESQAAPALSSVHLVCHSKLDARSIRPRVWVFLAALLPAVAGPGGVPALVSADSNSCGTGVTPSPRSVPQAASPAFGSSHDGSDSYAKTTRSSGGASARRPRLPALPHAVFPVALMFWKTGRGEC